MDSLMYGHAELQIDFTEIIRGEEAEKMAAVNEFNDPAGEGKEYIFAKFKFTNIKDLSSDDSAFEVNTAQFSFANSKFTKSDDFFSIYIDNLLDAELFEGADVEGYVPFISDIDDSSYAIYQDEIWFSLS